MMSSINKKAPSFHKVTGVQDISHESAAACSGGQQITLYDLPNYSGETRTLFGSTINLGTFSDRAESVILRGGTWELFTLENFGGSRLLLASSRSSFSSTFSNRIRSARLS